METSVQKNPVMEIRYCLPGKNRPRVFTAEYKAPIDAFRKLFKEFPEAIPISFDGNKITKSA